MERFTALVADRKDGKYEVGFRELTLDDIPDPDGKLDVDVEVLCSGLNYKDGLAITGKRPVVRTFPLALGIDLSGRVIASRSPDWKPGDLVIVNGCGLSETRWGGYSRKTRLCSEWLVPLPPQFTPHQAMMIGTAGYTAMLAILALEQHGFRHGEGEVAVTGAAGGVGSVAIALLAGLGNRVTAITGRPEEHGYLGELGATGILDRAELATAGPPLRSERWAAGIDSLGGVFLANLLASVCRGGAVAACGLAADTALPATVLPFILRRVSLLGIDSVQTPRALRHEAWKRLARDLPAEKPERMCRTIPFSGLPAAGEEILAGRVRGRIVVGMDS